MDEKCQKERAEWLKAREVAAPGSSVWRFLISQNMAKDIEPQAIYETFLYWNRPDTRELEPHTDRGQHIKPTSDMVDLYAPLEDFYPITKKTTQAQSSES